MAHSVVCPTVWAAKIWENDPESLDQRLGPYTVRVIHPRVSSCASRERKWWLGISDLTRNLWPFSLDLAFPLPFWTQNSW